MKWCNRCQQNKPLDEFHLNKGNHKDRATFCKPCNNERMRKHRAENPEKYSARLRKRKYGLSEEDFESLLKAQKGLCAICEERPATAVDHDHITRKVRGLLCNRCNLAIGALGDTVDGLMRAIDYLS